MDPLEKRLLEITRSLVMDYTELFALVMAEQGIPIGAQSERLNRMGKVVLNPRFEDTIFDNGRRVPLRYVEVLEFNKELLSRVSNQDILQALARPIAKILEVPHLNVALLFQTDDRFRKNIVVGVRRAKKQYIAPTKVASYVECRVKLFNERMSQIATTLLPNPSPPLLVETIRLSSEKWPDWEVLEDQDFVGSVKNWVDSTYASTAFESLAQFVAQLCWDTLSLTKQSALKNVGQHLRSLSYSDSETVLVAFADSLFEREELCLKQWSAFKEVVDAYNKVVQRERQIFGAAWDSDSPLLNVTKSAKDLFGFSKPSELPWEDSVVCWSAREIKALRDLLIGIDKTLPSHSLVPFKNIEPTNTILKLAVNLPAIGVSIAPPSTSVPSYDHALSAIGLNAARNLIVSKFFLLEDKQKHEIVVTMREALDSQYPQANRVWKRRLCSIENYNIEKKFVALVDAFRSLMGLPVLFDPFRSPDLDQIVVPSPVFVIGVHDTPFECSFGVPVPSIVATKKASAIRVRFVQVSTDEKCVWWGDRSIHMTKIETQDTNDMLSAILGDGLSFVFRA